MSTFVTRRPALLVAFCVLAAALTGMLLGRVTVSDAAPGADPRPVVEPITPCRILETRGPASGGPTGLPSAAPVGQNQTLTLQVAGATGQGTPPCTIAGGLLGAVLNVTAVNATADSFLTVYPCDKPRPNASTLNPFPDRITFNSAAVSLSASGTVCIYNNAGTVDVVADVTGIVYNHTHTEWLGNSVIPSGTTVVGTERWDLDANAAGSDFQLTISLPGRAPVQLTGATVNFAPVAGANDGDPSCAGSAAAPTAPAGKVCIYLVGSIGATGLLGDPMNQLRDRAFRVSWQATQTGDNVVEVTWAYTAP